MAVWAGRRSKEESESLRSEQMSPVRINRTPLVCKFCQKLDTNLSVHLHRVCQRKADPAQIQALVEEARSNMRKVLDNMSIVDYADPSFKNFSPAEMEGLVSFFEKSGVFVKGKPSPAERRDVFPVDVTDDLSFQKTSAGYYFCPPIFLGGPFHSLPILPANLLLELPALCPKPGSSRPPCLCQNANVSFLACPLVVLNEGQYVSGCWSTSWKGSSHTLHSFLHL